MQKKELFLKISTVGRKEIADDVEDDGIVCEIYCKRRFRS